jgi:hypothetical protein
MVVRFNAAAQRSDRIHGEARRMKGRGNPITGENICASLSVTDSGVDCGTVRNGDVSWVSDHGFIIRGADHDGITTHEGDSGSPLWRLSGTSYAVATGIHDTSFGGFAKMTDAVLAAGVGIYA